MLKQFIFILSLTLSATFSLTFNADNAYANKTNGLAAVWQKFPTLKALAASTIILTCGISGCMPKAVDSWLRGTRTAQAQAQRTAIGISAADDESHVFGYYDGYFAGEIVATGEEYYTVELYKHGKSRQIPKQAVEAVLIAGHPDIGSFHNLPTDVVGMMHLRGEVVGVYRYLDHADALLYVYHVQESIDLAGQVQPHDDSIVYRNVRNVQAKD